jgi:dihydrodipicolinate synthase/N-acetylneuraminate lyase
VPTEIVEVVRLIDAGKLAEALAGWNKVYPVIDTMITQDSFISAVKSGLRHRGLPVGVPASPHGRRLRRSGRRHRCGRRPTRHRLTPPPDVTA